MDACCPSSLAFEAAWRHAVSTLYAMVLNEAKEALRAACGVRSLDELESALSQAAKASLPAGACPSSLLAGGVRG